MRSTRWTQALREGTVAGTVGAVLSTLVLGVVGRRQNGSPPAPINAASHWLWGKESLREDRWTWRHTLPGFLTQHAASVMWATLYAAVHGHRPEAKRLPDAIAGGIATSAVAYVIDYTVTPKRFTPGYEERLDGKGMLAVYAALAVGFTLGALALRSSQQRQSLQLVERTGTPATGSDAGPAAVTTSVDNESGLSWPARQPPGVDTRH